MLRLRNYRRLASELTTPQEWREAFAEYLGSMAGIDGIVDTDIYDMPDDEPEYADYTDELDDLLD